MTDKQQTSLQAAEQELEKILGKSTKTSKVADELFDFASVLRQNGSLLRSLTNPGRLAKDRVELVDQITKPVYSAGTVKMLDWLVEGHWAKPDRLTKIIEDLGVWAILYGAKNRGELAQVAEELFEVSRMLMDERQLRIQLSNLGEGSSEQRVDLIEGILKGHVLPATLDLVAEATRRSKHGQLLQTLRWYGQEAAEIANAQQVIVTTATPFSAAQEKRLQALLEKQIGKPVVMAIAVDPDLIGGFKINYGDEAADSTILTEIGEARRALVR